MEDKQILEELLKVSKENTEVLHFMQENMVTKDDLREELKNFATKDDLKGFVTKDDLNGVEGRLDKKIDDLKETMELRFAEMSRELDDIKTTLDRLEIKVQEDDDAILLEVESLKKRVSVLEMQLQKRQMAGI